MGGSFEKTKISSSPGSVNSNDVSRVFASFRADRCTALDRSSSQMEKWNTGSSSDSSARRVIRLLDLSLASQRIRNEGTEARGPLVPASCSILPQPGRPLRRYQLDRSRSTTASATTGKNHEHRGD